MPPSGHRGLGKDLAAAAGQMNSPIIGSDWHVVVASPSWLLAVYVRLVSLVDISQ